MKKVTVEVQDFLSGEPETIVQSHTRNSQITSIHFNVKKNAKQDEEEQDSFSCSMLSIVSGTHLTIEDVMRIIYEHDMWSPLSGKTLHDIALHFDVDNSSDLAAALVSGKYTIAQELSCHRKAINGDTDSLEELNLFVEQCKRKAREAFQS